MEANRSWPLHKPHKKCGWNSEHFMMLASKFEPHQNKLVFAFLWLLSYSFREPRFRFRTHFRWYCISSCVRSFRLIVLASSMCTIFYNNKFMCAYCIYNTNISYHIGRMRQNWGEHVVFEAVRDLFLLAFIAFIGPFFQIEFCPLRK